MVSRAEAATTEMTEDSNTMFVWKLLALTTLMWTIIVAGGFCWLGWHLAPKQPRRSMREAGIQTEKLPPPPQHQQPKQPQQSPPTDASSSSTGLWNPAVSDLAINSLRQELSKRKLSCRGQKEELAERLNSAVRLGAGIPLTG